MADKKNKSNSGEFDPKKEEMKNIRQKNDKEIEDSAVTRDKEEGGRQSLSGQKRKSENTPENREEVKRREREEGGRAPEGPSREFRP